MTPRIRVTVLVENTAQGRGLLAEHGLAFFIEARSGCVLFDTGQGGALATNAFRMNVALRQLDAVVLSHGHYDHTGGLSVALQGNDRATIHAHPESLHPKYMRDCDGCCREIGIPDAGRHAIERRRQRLVLTAKPSELDNGLMLTGSIPRVTDFEDTGGPFFLDPECRGPDPLLDDQAVFFDTAKGSVVLLGCAHAGVVNTLRYVHELTDGRPIHAVFGGMHLAGASPRRLEATLDAFRRMDVRRLGPAHCTGRAATATLWNEMPDRCVPCHVGTRLEFPLAEMSSVGA